MSKLFSHEDFDIEQDGDNLIEAKIENSDIPDMAEVHETSIQVSVEGVLKAASDLYIVKDIQASLESKKLSSVEYFTSIENYSLFMKSISTNLGISTKIPSMEDFKNPYGIKASHQFVMEGFTDFIKSIWEKIKSFFKDFFKKIMLFMKRLVNANLEMDEYEQYIESLMRNVKKSDKKNVEPIIIDSKLPTMLCDLDMTELTFEYLRTKGSDKLLNLSSMIDTVSNIQLANFQKSLSSFIKDLDSKFDTINKKDHADVMVKTGEIRQKCLDDFSDTLFNVKLPFEDLPDEVQNDIMNNFTSDQLKSSEVKYFSLTDDRVSHYRLPNNFNLYLVTTSFDTASDHTNIRTSKLFVTHNSESNANVQKTMKTIGNRDELIKVYEFYKKFSKELKIKSVNDRLQSIDKSIDSLIKGIVPPFTHVLARENSEPEASSAQALMREYGSTPAETPMPTSGSEEQSIDQNSKVHPQANKELDSLNKFILSYMQCIQTYLRIFSVNITASGQECRYEMIKLLYKSAKQF